MGEKKKNNVLYRANLFMTQVTCWMPFVDHITIFQTSMPLGRLFTIPKLDSLLQPLVTLLILEDKTFLLLTP